MNGYAPYPAATPNYGSAGSGYYATTPGSLIPESYRLTDWNEYYVPTVQQGARQLRPVIYIAVQLPPGVNQFF